jgi:hypothetical protein
VVDPECPWWVKLCRAESLIDEIRHRGAQQSREWLEDRSGDAEEAVVYRIRLIEPISASSWSRGLSADSVGVEGLPNEFEFRKWAGFGSEEG